MNPIDIETKLETLPAEIARSSEEHLIYLETFRKSQEHLKTYKAKALLLAKTCFPKMTQLELQAKVDSESEEQRLRLIDSEIKVKKAEVKVKALDDMLMSVKVIARLKIVEMGSIEPTIRREPF